MEWYYLWWHWLTSKRVARVCQHQLSFLLCICCDMGRASWKRLKYMWRWYWHVERECRRVNGCRSHPVVLQSSVVVVHAYVDRFAQIFHHQTELLVPLRVEVPHHRPAAIACLAVHFELHVRIARTCVRRTQFRLINVVLTRTALGRVQMPDASVKAADPAKSLLLKNVPSTPFESKSRYKIPKKHFNMGVK